jgi:hypothetical protein
VFRQTNCQYALYAAANTAACITLTAFFTAAARSTPPTKYMRFHALPSISATHAGWCSVITHEWNQLPLPLTSLSTAPPAAAALLAKKAGANSGSRASRSLASAVTAKQCHCIVETQQLASSQIPKLGSSQTGWWSGCGQLCALMCLCGHFTQQHSSAKPQLFASCQAVKSRMVVSCRCPWPPCPQPPLLLLACWQSRPGPTQVAWHTPKLQAAPTVRHCTIKNC